MTPVTHNAFSGAIAMRTIFLTAAMVLVAAASGWAQTTKPVSVLIITGDHGHNWKATTPFLKELLTKAGHKVEVTERPKLDLIPANLAKYDVLLLNYRNTGRGAMENADSVWTDDNKRAFKDAVETGKGLVVLSPCLVSLHRRHRVGPRV